MMKSRRDFLKRCKILIIGPTPPPYFGVSTATENILRGLKERGWGVLHLDTRDPRDVGNMGKLDLVNVWLGVKHVVGMFLLMLKSPKVVYLPISQSAGGFFRDGMFILLGWFFGARVIVHLRGSNFLNFYGESPRFFQWYIRFTLRRVYLGLVQGRNIQYVLEPFIKRIGVLPNGLDCRLFNEVRRQRRDRKVRFLFLANFMATKGGEEFVRAGIEVWKGNRGKVEFYLAGDFVDEEVKRRILSLIPEGAPFRFVGIVRGREKVKFLVNGDVFVFPPIAPEGQPWVILEAMAAGLPVIASSVGAVPETVVDGETGFVVSPGDVDAIVGKLDYLISHPKRRREMGRAGRERLLKLYTLDAFFDRMERFLIHACNT